MAWHHQFMLFKKRQHGIEQSHSAFQFGLKQRKKCPQWWKIDGADKQARYENVPHSMCAAKQTKQNNLVTCEEWAWVEDITTIVPPIANHILSMQTHENLLDVWHEYKATAALIFRNRGMFDNPTQSMALLKRPTASTHNVQIIQRFGCPPREMLCPGKSASHQELSW